MVFKGELYDRVFFLVVVWRWKEGSKDGIGKSFWSLGER